jgi:predicted membrane protein
MTRASSRSCLTPQLAIGVVLLGLGVLFLLNNLGIFPADRVLRYWPAALILIGGLKLLQARSFGGAVGGSIWILLGTWWLLDNLGVVTLDFWTALLKFWPIILVVMGLSIVWRTIRRGADPERRLDASDFVKIAAIVGGQTRVSGTADLTGGELTAFMGGIDLDLRKATIRREAVIDLFVFWGGVDLKVPEGWVVESRVAVFMGGYEDKTRPVADAGAPRLVLRGMTIMGGIEVKN